MGYPKMDAKGDVTGAARPFDTKIAATQDAREIARLRSERSAAIGSVLEKNMKIVFCEGNKFFAKVDIWVGQAERYMQEGKCALERYQQYGKSCDFDMVTYAPCTTRELHKVAVKEAKEFGESWFTYREIDPVNTYKVFKEDVSPFCSLRAKLMADSKEYVVKVARIEEIAKRGDVLVKQAKVDQVKWGQADAECIENEKDVKEVLDDAKRTVANFEIEETKAAARLKTLNDRLAQSNSFRDAKAKKDTQLVTEGVKKDILSALKKMKDQLRTLEISVKCARSRVEGQANPVIRKAFQEAERHLDAATKMVSDYGKEVVEAMKVKAKIDKNCA